MKINKVIVFGLGAIGSNLLLNLVKLYPGIEYVGIDYDKVEDRNLRTQAYFTQHIGIPKVNAMQIVLNMKVNSVKYTPINKFINKKHDIYDGNILPPVVHDISDTLLIDCFDNTKSRQLLEGIDNCLHIGFSPKYTAEIIWGKNYTAPPNIKPEENDICDMSQAVPFINYVVAMATYTVQNYIESGVQDSWLVLDKYKLRKL